MRYSTLLVVCFALYAQANAASITLLPEGANHLSLSPNGRRLEGVVADKFLRWTVQGGLETVATLPAHTVVTAISGNGDFAVGRRVSMNSQEAVRWRIGGEVAVLPGVPDYPNNPSPHLISDDGSVVYVTAQTHFSSPVWDLYNLGEISSIDFGDSGSLDNRSAEYRWGVHNRVDLLTSWTQFGGNPTPFFIASSADGKTAAGTIGKIPAIWGAQTGLIQPAIFTSKFDFARVSNLSADGSTVIGDFDETDSKAPHAYRWQASGGFEPLTNRAEYFSDTLATSADGEIILGRFQQQEAGPSFEFLWRKGVGMQNVLDFFAAQGVQLPLDGSNEVYEMSRDGTIFHGATLRRHIDNDGTTIFTSSAWIVDLNTSVPEPSSLVQALVGIATFASWLCRM